MILTHRLATLFYHGLLSNIPIQKERCPMTDLFQVIQVLQKELTEMLLKGYNPKDPEVIRKSQELDKLVTAYYKYEYEDSKEMKSFPGKKKK